METFFFYTYLFNLVSFVGYGISCLATQYMVAEFKRYRLPQLRVFAGVMQILASIILSIGFYIPLAILAGSALIIAMMFFGIVARQRIGDSLLKMFPAIFYFILNIGIFSASAFYEINLP